MILLGIPIALLATPLIYLILLNKGYVTRTNFGIFTIPKLFFFRQGEISINNLLQYGGYSLKTILPIQGNLSCRTAIPFNRNCSWN